MKRTPTPPPVRAGAKALASAFTSAFALTLTLALVFTLALARDARAQGAPPVVVVVGEGQQPQRQQPAQQQRQQPPQPVVRPPAQTESQREAARGREAREAREARAAGSGTIKGRVVGESGEPLAGVGVSVSPRGVGPQFFRPQRTVTDDEGNFAVTGLDPGVYNVGAGLPGYVTEPDISSGRPPFYRPGDTASIRLVKGGVITGAVTDAQGEPLVGVTVRAYRVRDLDARANSAGGFGNEDNTDDRGVFRIYSLQPGVYVVSAGGAGRGSFYGMATAFEGNVLTFYPAATRDTASEVTVRGGQETAGIDIRYRDEPGRRVTGRVELPAGAPADSAVTVTLYYSGTNAQANMTYVPPQSSERSFSLEGVADGDYDAQASGATREGPVGASAPQRVSVRGADVTGLRLALAPLASVGGTLVVERAPAAEKAREACKAQQSSLLPQENLVVLTADRAAPAKGQPAPHTSFARDATPEASGAFNIRALEPGRYRLSARPLDEALYVRSVQPPAQAAAAVNAAGRAAAVRDSIEVGAGQQLSGASVRLAEGAAQLSGRVTVAEGAAAPPFSLLRVHLVPAERESADDALRYFEATPDASGAFVFRSLPPGRYLLVARPAPDPDPSGPTRPAHWDADSRARLRREAEAANAPAELQPCQRTNDFALRFPAK